MHQLKHGFFPIATSIEQQVFCGCSSFISASFPLVTSIGMNAFSIYTSLDAVSFPAATSISMSAFSNCSNLSTASFPAVTSIGDYVFMNCNNLSTASFPLATSIGDKAFDECSILRALSLGTALTVDTDITVGTNLFGFTSIAGNIDLTLDFNVDTTKEEGITDIAAKKYKGYEFKIITKDQSSSIAKAVGAAAFRIYPNPTTGVVNIEGAASPQVRVLSLQGALLQQSQGNSINLGSYANGVYLVNVNGESYRVVKK